MKDHIKEAEESALTSKPKSTQVDGVDVVRSMERGFKEHVKPTWVEWKKEAEAAQHKVS